MSEMVWVWPHYLAQDQPSDDNLTIVFVLWSCLMEAWKVATQKTRRARTSACCRAFRCVAVGLSCLCLLVICFRKGTRLTSMYRPRLIVKRLGVAPSDSHTMSTNLLQRPRDHGLVVSVATVCKEDSGKPLSSREKERVAKQTIQRIKDCMCDVSRWIGPSSNVNAQLYKRVPLNRCKECGFILCATMLMTHDPHLAASMHAEA
eukprot:37605-Amphidinium_carterae.1